MKIRYEARDGAVFETQAGCEAHEATLHPKLAFRSFKEWARGGYSCCPFCGSSDIVGQETTFDVGCVSQEVTCSSCDVGGQGWYEHYTMTNAYIRGDVEVFPIHGGDFPDVMLGGVLYSVVKTEPGNCNGCVANSHDGVDLCSALKQQRSCTRPESVIFIKRNPQ